MKLLTGILEDLQNEKNQDIIKMCWLYSLNP